MCIRDRLQQLKEGKNIALVSDAGMPGISDPGYDLVQQCLEEDIPFTVLPGAVAAVTGLVSVSYTHLDVYKRQSYGCWRFCTENLRLLPDRYRPGLFRHQS